MVKQNLKLFIKIARYFYCISIAGIGFQQFMYADFRAVILPLWPAWLHVAVLAYITGVALIAASIFILLEKKDRTVSLLLGGFLFVLFIAFQCTYILFVQPNSPRHLGLWTDALKELALAGGAFIMAQLSVNTANNHTTNLLEKLMYFGRIFFGIMLIAFGLDHFYYTDFVATLVPSWIPANIFWTYFAGVALIGSGAAIILKILIKPVSLLLSAMLLLWFILLHMPRAISDPYTGNGNEITSVFEALAFSGIALGIACIYTRSSGR